MLNGDISRRANIFDFPSFRYYYKMIDEKQKEGKRVYNLYKMNPPSFFAELKEEVSEEKLIEKFLHIYNIPKNFKVLVFPGTIPALSTIFFTFLDTNDEVLTPEPLFHYLKISSDIAQVKLNVIKTYYYNNFSIPSRDLIEPLITSRVKCIFISNPQFFSGNVYSEEEMERISFLSNTYRIPLILDETYFFSVFENVVFHSAINLRLNHHRIFIINRLIESYSDINLVFIATTPTIYNSLRKFRDELFPLNNMLTSAGSLFLSNFISGLINFKKRLFDNAEYLYKAILSKDFSVIKPFAAPCMIIKIPFNDSDGFTNFMLNVFEENGSTVFAMPMTDFFIDREKGKELLSINFSNIRKDELEEGVKLLKTGMSYYLKEVQ